MKQSHHTHGFNFHPHEDDLQIYIFNSDLLSELQIHISLQTTSTWISQSTTDQPKSEAMMWFSPASVSFTLPSNPSGSVYFFLFAFSVSTLDHSYHHLLPSYWWPWIHSASTTSLPLSIVTTGILFKMRIWLCHSCSSSVFKCLNDFSLWGMGRGSCFQKPTQSDSFHHSSWIFRHKPLCCLSYSHLCLAVLLSPLPQGLCISCSDHQ